MNQQEISNALGGTNSFVIIINRLSRRTVIALFVGFPGIAASGLVFQEFDEIFYKDQFEEQAKHCANLQSRITSCETEMADTKANHAELETEMKTLESSKNTREQFIQNLRNSLHPSL